MSQKDHISAVLKIRKEGIMITMTGNEWHPYPTMKIDA